MGPSTGQALLAQKEHPRSVFGVRPSAVLDPPGCVRACAAAGLNMGSEAKKGRAGPLQEDRNTVVFWLGFWFWLGHLGAALSHFFASLAVVGAWGDHPPSGVVGGGPRVPLAVPH
jgi:hypothetical protein